VSPPKAEAESAPETPPRAATLTASQQADRIATPISWGVEVASQIHPQGPLTPQEIEVMESLAKGFVWKEIAEHLQLESKALWRIRRRCFSKLGHARNRSQALANWYRPQHPPSQPDGS
jgi:DNA-binding NarL/FixJ family response regulator